MRRAAACVAALVLSGCFGDKVVPLASGYEWIKHDGESQVVTSEGDIVVDHVLSARADGSIILGKRESGATFLIDVRTGNLREKVEGSS